MAELKSFYTLDLFIGPGAGRKATTYVFGSLAEIKQALEVEFSRGIEVYLLIYYGEDIWLSTYHHGKMVNEINLLPYITVDIPGEGVFSIDENQQVSPPIADDEDDDDSLSARLFTDEVEEYTIIIDWSKLAIPDLIAPILQPKEVTLASDRYMGTKVSQSEIDEFLQCQTLAELEDLGIFYYGWNDGEAGITSAELEPDDPFITLQPVARHVRFQ
ncbi:hypothetical protein [Chamaesiphon minutus]|uniref:Uncharacterized protein n=1 Tax=Chamaesiphon minutus (strain ATCC 27169 / PCC 6605) TaxID=1173020 RepID=K9UJ76_CHAP6|nr:hypothetical protein [Chamaesiphon minutus]AFY94845.1 hypothetical protein Cha6605_3877 [Chamaesiphon minutus PCC 6605]